MAVTTKTSGSITAVLSATITGITKANPAVVTATAHGLATGDNGLVSGVGGMTEVNDRRFTITKIDADSFSLDGEDSTGHTTYTSGGTMTENRQVLATVSDAGIYAVLVGKENLVADETVTLRLFDKVRSGDGEGLLFPPGTYSAHDGLDIAYSPPQISPHHMRVTIEQTNGTGRAFTWAIRATGA